MIIKKEIDCYNERRYGRPWAAIVTFAGIKTHYNFTGNYIHNDSVGSSGEVQIMAKKDDIIAFGQKDNRGNNNKKDFFVVKNDKGDLESISQLDAQEKFLAEIDAQSITRDKLIKETALSLCKDKMSKDDFTRLIELIN